jgi:hypothetical protein
MNMFGVPKYTVNTEEGGHGGVADGPGARDLHLPMCLEEVTTTSSEEVFPSTPATASASRRALAGDFHPLQPPTVVLASPPPPRKCRERQLHLVPLRSLGERDRKEERKRKGGIGK